MLDNIIFSIFGFLSAILGTFIVNLFSKTQKVGFGKKLIVYLIVSIVMLLIATLINYIRRKNKND